MALVPGSLQIDIFVTNTPKDPKPMPPAGTDSEKRRPDSQSGSKPERHSWTPSKYSATLHTPQTSQPSSMEDLPSNDSYPMIYVTTPEGCGSRVTLSDDHNTLLVPNPHIGLPGGRYGEGGLMGKDHEYEMGMGRDGDYQEDSAYDVLDYTHFDGDLDAEVLPAEDSLSRRVRQEGAVRRRKARKIALGYHTRDNSCVRGQQVASPMPVANPGWYTKSSPLSSLHGHGSGRERGRVHSLTLDVSEATLTGKQTRRVSVPVYLQQYEPGQRDSNEPRDKRADRASMVSIRDSVVDVSTVHSMMPKTGKGARGEEMEIQFSEEELEDVLAMAEYAWPGRPMLDKLLQEEVEMARGAIVVACGCFSPSLLALHSL